MDRGPWSSLDYCLQITIISNRSSWAYYYFKLMSLSVLPAFIYGYSSMPQAYRDQKGSVGSFRTEIIEDFKPSCRYRNQLWGFYKRNVFSLLLNHISSPGTFHFMLGKCLSSSLSSTDGKWNPVMCLLIWSCQRWQGQGWWSWNHMVRWHLGNPGQGRYILPIRVMWMIVIEGLIAKVTVIWIHISLWCNFAILFNEWVMTIKLQCG